MKQAYNFSPRASSPSFFRCSYFRALKEVASENAERSTPPPPPPPPPLPHLSHSIAPSIHYSGGVSSRRAEVSRRPERSQPSRQLQSGRPALAFQVLIAANRKWELVVASPLFSSLRFSSAVRTRTARLVPEAINQGVLLEAFWGGRSSGSGLWKKFTRLLKSSRGQLTRE